MISRPIQTSTIGSMWRALFLSVLFGIVISPASAQEMHIGTIAFFGQQGLDIAAIRAALPVHEGSSYPAAKAARDTWKQNIRDAVKQQIGKAPTDVTVLCCEHGSILSLYIGLPGKSSHPVAYNAVPKGSARLPASFVKLGDDIGEGVVKALQEGGHGGEDDSAGYALFNDPAVRQMQLQVHDFALKNESLIYKVLATSSDSKHRSDAAEALGYARQSKKQIDALVRASFDADDEVRNSAIRALGVLLTAKPELGRYVPAERLIRLLNSERWTDRNKASLVLFAMTKTRDSELLGKLRAEALPSLIEMSQFALGHAIGNAVILGRVIGIEESQLAVGKLSQPGKIEQIMHKAEGL
jgi:hypothetical protein